MEHVDTTAPHQRGPRTERPPTIRRAMVAIGAPVLVFASACGAVDEQSQSPEPGGAETTSPEVTTPAPETYPNYVALGDSYAAMGSTADEVPESGVCRRSATNYPSLLATEADDRIETLTDVTCGGAVLPDLMTEQHPGVPPQLDALGEETDLVTVSIGGNDIGFGRIVECVAQAAFVGGGQADCAEQLADETDSTLAELGSSLDDIHDEIARRSPDATVVATQYLPMLPRDGTCPFIDGIRADDREWLADLTDEVNDVVAEAAERAGHLTVLPETDVDRSGCAAPDERWVDFTGGETGSVPMHPTAAGQQAMAEAVLEVL